MANSAPWPMSGPRRSVLVTTAATTGTRLRGRHSNSSSHHADDEPAHHGRQQDEQRLVVPGAGRHEARVQALVEDEVGDEADQPQQRQRQDGARRADRDGARGDCEHAAAEREVAQVIDPLADGRRQRIR
jgi:hypothetical protein